MKTDRRIKYTKMVLKQSLLALLKDNSIDKITVKEICNLADINRGTFYKHYNEPADLLHEIEDELLSDINNVLSSTPKQTAPNSNVVYEVFDCVAQKSDLIKILLGQFGDTEFIKKILYMANKQFVDDWSKIKQVKDPVLMDYLFSYIANGGVGIVQLWIQRDLKESATEIAALLEKTMFNGLQAFSEEKLS